MPFQEVRKHFWLQLYRNANIYFVQLAVGTFCIRHPTCVTAKTVHNAVMLAEPYSFRPVETIAIAVLMILSLNVEPLLFYVREIMVTSVRLKELSSDLRKNRLYVTVVQDDS